MVAGTTKTQTYWTYEHRAGYGRDDHMAGEIIARAAERLGLDTGNAIAQHIGLASHSVPMPDADIRLPDARGAKRRMLAALRAAEREVSRRDCMIIPVRVRLTVTEDCERYCTRIVVQHWRGGRDWEVIEGRTDPWPDSRVRREIERREIERRSSDRCGCGYAGGR